MVKGERIILTAGDGMVLTNGVVFGKNVYLGVSDHPDNWHEITEAEYNEIIEKERMKEDV
jgi:hypothetical protein